ncbi:MAG: PDZ domain-containing protein [Bacteroidales bacterium]|nr:PDZ domain-containing protein [Bacteroidales bacterium]
MIALLFTFSSANGQSSVSANANKIGQTLFYIERLYLDTANIERLTDNALVSIMKELDPHSSYISKKDIQAMNEPLQGNFDGIGVEFALINDTLTINSTIPGGPSEKVGIRAGDKIVAVDGEVISGTGLTIERVHKYLRGPKGTKVKVSVVRRGVQEPLEFVITRDKIPLNSIDSYYMIGDGIVYLRLTRFAATSYKEMLEALSSLKVMPKGIILDFRGNPGGYLMAAIQIANEFLEEGELIVYTEGRTVKKMEDHANGSGILQNVPVAILIDENSASASEIVSGAIQDWDRGTIIGRRSFGKGLVQQQLPLPDGSALRLTVARYHTPSGRVIQSPYEEGKKDEYYKKLMERYSRGESFSKDSIHFADSLVFKTLKKGRTVYGGGGIMPDIFIPQDTSHYTPFYGEILRKGLLTDYMNEYSDKHRSDILKKYPSFRSFENKFVVSDKDIADFLAYCASKGVKPKEGDMAISGNEIRRNFKGLIIRSVYSFSNFIEFLNKEDKEVLKAVEVLTKGE